MIAVRVRRVAEEQPNPKWEVKLEHFQETLAGSRNIFKNYPIPQKIIRTTRTHCGWCLSDLLRKKKRDVQRVPRRALITMPALTSETSLGWQKLKLDFDKTRLQMCTL